jgi:xylan 1,4-beta-xylosidase
LGRETALQKVEWTEKGWLRLAQGGHHPLLQVSAPTGVGVAESTDSDIFGSFDDPFTSEDLDTQKWSFLRKFPDETWLRATSCGLEISGGQSPQSAFDQHLIATRQTAFHCKASVDMEYKPVNYLQMAGMTLYLDIANYVLLMVTANDDDSTSVVLQKCVAGDFSEVTRVPVRPGKYRLSIEMEDERARFRVTEVDISSVDTGEASEPKALGELDIAFLSGGFTGNFIGVDAIDMYRRNSSMARFTNFEYTVL